MTWGHCRGVATTSRILYFSEADSTHPDPIDLMSKQHRLSRFFEFEKRQTDIYREVLGGITTFATMAYIIVVNPAILEKAGIPIGASTVATILTAVFGCFLMGVYANLPIAVAPYMGENAFIAFGLAALGIGWEMRL